MSKAIARFEPFRDAISIVIATEGEFTEPQYFDSLTRDSRYRNTRVKITVIPTVDGLSSPQHVIQRLDAVKDKLAGYDGDQLWLVIDTDRWPDAMLRDVVQLAFQKGYLLADSNPSFELWLLLHHKALREYDDDTLDAFRRNKKTGNRTRLEQELIDICGSYNKSNLKTSDYLPTVGAAIANARASDVIESDRWLNQIGTRVYKLVQSIIESSPHNPRH